MNINSNQADNLLKVDVHIDPESQEYVVSTRNVSSVAVTICDRISTDWHEFTEDDPPQKGALAEIRISSEDGMVLSSSPGTESDGWIHIASDNNVLDKPATMRTLLPGETITGRYSLLPSAALMPSAVTARSAPDYSKWLRGKFVEIRVTVEHTNPYLTQTITVTSQKTRIK